MTDILAHIQCDQIGQFNGLWATFQSLWQHLICPNLLHSEAIFVKVSKSLIFIVISFWATIIDDWRLFTGHTAHILTQILILVHTSRRLQRLL